MKTSEELFSNKSDCYADTGQFQNDGSFQEGEVIQAMTKEKFVEAITEDRQQIEDMIKEEELNKFDWFWETLVGQGYKRALTELLTKMKELN